jgi:hypothetical protein
MTGKAPILSQLDSKARSWIAQAARLTTFRVRLANGFPSDVVDWSVWLKLVSEDPFGAVVHFEAAHWKNLEESEVTPFFSQVHHRLLIVIALFGALHRNEMEGNNFKACLKSSIESIQALLQQASPSDRSQADSFLVCLKDYAAGLMGSKTGDKSSKAF